MELTDWDSSPQSLWEVCPHEVRIFPFERVCAQSLVTPHHASGQFDPSVIDVNGTVLTRTRVTVGLNPAGEDIGDCDKSFSRCPLRLHTLVPGSTEPSQFWDTVSHNMLELDNQTTAEVVDAFQVRQSQRFKAHASIEYDEMDAWKTQQRISSYAFVPHAQVTASAAIRDGTETPLFHTNKLFDLELDVATPGPGVLLITATAKCYSSIPGDELHLWFLINGTTLPNYRSQLDLTNERAWGVRVLKNLPHEAHACSLRRLVPITAGQHVISVGAQNVAGSLGTVQDLRLKAVFIPGAKHIVASHPVNMPIQCPLGSQSLVEVPIVVPRKALVIATVMLNTLVDPEEIDQIGLKGFVDVQLRANNQVLEPSMHDAVQRADRALGHSVLLTLFDEFGPSESGLPEQKVALHLVPGGPNPHTWCASDMLLEVAVIDIVPGE